MVGLCLVPGTQAGRSSSLLHGFAVNELGLICAASCSPVRVHSSGGTEGACETFDGGGGGGGGGMARFSSSYTVSSRIGTRGGVLPWASCWAPCVPACNLVPYLLVQHLHASVAGDGVLAWAAVVCCFDCICRQSALGVEHAVSTRSVP